LALYHPLPAALFSCLVTNPKYFLGFPHIQHEQTVLFLERCPLLFTCHLPIFTLLYRFRMILSR
jgi:hypothetical protein